MPSRPPVQAVNRCAHRSPLCPPFTAVPTVHRRAHRSPLCPPFTAAPTDCCCAELSPGVPSHPPLRRAVHRCAEPSPCAGREPLCRPSTAVPAVRRCAERSPLCPPFTAVPTVHRCARRSPLCSPLTAVLTDCACAELSTDLPSSPRMCRAVHRCPERPTPVPSRAPLRSGVHDSAVASPRCPVTTLCHRCTVVGRQVRLLSAVHVPRPASGAESHVQLTGRPAPHPCRRDRCPRRSRRRPCAHRVSPGGRDAGARQHDR